jgi:hypothetical protein
MTTRENTDQGVRLLAGLRTQLAADPARQALPATELPDDALYDVVSGVVVEQPLGVIFQWRGGVWQRQGDRLVPITDAEYAGHVDQCLNHDCNQCDGCEWENRHYANLVTAAGELDQAVTDALATVARAMDLADELRTDGTNWDLTGIDVEDLKLMLRQAKWRLRGAGRITGPHAAKLTRLHKTGQV